VTGAARAAGVGRTVDVLVVDDDEGARTTLVDILVLAGLSARAVGTAGEALAGRDGAIPQLAIVDYGLPDTTGLELAARLKDADPDLPVIVLTGNASLETAVAAVGQVDEYLTKPVVAARLLRSVRAGLEQRRLRCENRDLLGRLRDANLTLEARVRDRTEELHADRERLAEAQRIARVGSWEWDFETATLTCSTELRRLYGVDAGPEVTSYEELFTRLPADDQHRIWDVVREAVARSEPFTFETSVAISGDQPRWLRVQGRIQVDGDGRPVRLVGTSQDVTDRKRAEAQFRDLLESAPDAMIIAAEDGRIVLANRQAERLFGWPRHVLVERTIESLLPDHLREEHRRHRAHYHRAPPDAPPTREAIDLVAVRADGTTFPVEVTLGPVQTADGVLVCAAVRDVTERKRAETALAHQALHDALTGLPNRLLLVDRLEQALGRAARTDGKVAVLFLDIDRFKLVNDSRGHAAGDELILGVAERLRATVRPTDTVARFGGDEFVVVCQEVGTLSEAIAVADRIAVAMGEPFLVAGQEMFLTVSAGIAISGRDPSSETLLRNADAAMYRAKDQGRARCEFFDETMQTKATARLELQTALHWAVQRDELRVFYQPLVDVGSGHAVGVEALVRWDHPEQGIVTPETFILLAEETGLIVPIGSSVLREAARDHVQWGAVSSDRPFTISVNLSAHQLRHPGLLDQVQAVLDQHGLEASSLCLELTETALLEDLDRHIGVLMALRSLGVRLALDDFGTGYSSLTYLKRFPVDIVKIDRSFVNGLGVDHYDTTIVRGVIELAHALDLVVVAEGIERPEQWEQLRHLGCDLAQGYLFSPPVPADVLLDHLAVHPGWGEGIPLVELLTADRTG
jgi:diguanylate cyclase (GGDEF)-like protein/PAS domain S-box-containing protein